MRQILIRRGRACACAALVGVLLDAGVSATARAAVPGIAGAALATEVSGALNPVFNLSAGEDYLSQPDGTNLYSWGFGCASAAQPVFLPAHWVSPGGSGAAQSALNAAATPNCPLMQVPGPTLIVQEGAQVTVRLTNNLPVAAGNTSMVFAGLQVSAAAADPSRPNDVVQGVATLEAVHLGTVSYVFTASKAGTYAYYSGTQADVQIDMGLSGALIVLPAPAAAQAVAGAAAGAGTRCGRGPYSLAASAYDNVYTCYDREYLFQLSEASLAVHQGALDQVQACRAALLNATAAACPPIRVPTEPYRPDFFLINGRSMPDDMDAHYVQTVAHQPYNANPHMLPGENILIRVIGQGRIQHPFHIHGNHARVLARDGNLLVAQADLAAQVPLLTQRPGGPLLFTLSSVSGQTVDAIFSWSGKGLNWDVYGHDPGDPRACNAPPVSPAPRLPGVGYVDAGGFDSVTHEWCADHGKPMPVTPPDPLVVANGQWYSGSPWLGLQSAAPVPLPPTGSRLNSDGGYAYMWHSHDEREITTRNVFPGGLMTMLIIDPPGTAIDETQ